MIVCFVDISGIVDNQFILSLRCKLGVGWLVSFMVFNATFNNISLILWRSVLLVKETRVPGENH